VQDDIESGEGVGTRAGKELEKSGLYMVFGQVLFD
jgi:hypothetical protein